MAVTSTADAAEQIRAARGSLSRAEAARRSGFPLRTLEAWEQGLRTPKPYALPIILEKLRAADDPLNSAEMGS